MKKVIFTLAIATLFLACAKRATPTGGAKDTIPPILVKSVPKINTVNFKDNRIKIYFDEYIKIKDLRKNLIVSPPLKTEPVITPVGTASKFITIKILDTLVPNTTYQFNFGNSIVDNNEENALGNFKYIFSTGNYIDSLEVSGSVYNPLKKETLKEVDVFLYKYDSIFTDSLIYKKRPNYVSNTLDSSFFNLSNVKKGKYLLIALMDKNKNKIFNPKTDKIGFIKDTIIFPTTKEYKISIFKEILPLKFMPPREVSKGHLIIGYEGIANNSKIQILNKTPKNFKQAIEFEKDKDTINYWFTPFKTDSIMLKITNTNYQKIVTTKLRSSKTDSLTIDLNVRSEITLLDTLKIKTSTPIISFNHSKVSLLESDSIPIKFTSKIRTSQKEIDLYFNKEESKNYSLKMLPNTITDFFLKSNDSLSFSFRTKAKTDYGKIILAVKNLVKENLIIELYKENYEVVQSKKITSSEKVLFEYITPGKYFIRAIVDSNNNGKWDTGNFLKKQQPEPIIYFNKEIQIRSNWDYNDTFVIKK